MSITQLMVLAGGGSEPSSVALEFLGSVSVGEGLNSSVNVSTSSLSTPTASSYAIIVTAGAQGGPYTALTDANSNTYTNHGSRSDGNGEYAIVYGTNAEVTSMPSTLNFSGGGSRLAIGVYALSNATSLTPVDTYVSYANRTSPIDLDVTTQVGDVFVAVMGHEDGDEGTCVHTSDGSADIEDWDINPGGCRGVGGSATAVGTTTQIRFTSGSTQARGCAVMAAWR